MKLLSYLPVVLLSGFFASVGSGDNDGVLPLPTPSGSLMQGVATGPGIIAPVGTAQSYLNQFTAVWYLEETTTATRVNSAGTGTCGGTATDCNLSQTGSPTNDTSTFIQGTASNTFDGGDELSCTSCSALNVNNASVSFGCWVFHNYVSDTAHDGTLLGKSDGTSGYELNQDYRVINSAWVTTRCKVSGGFFSAAHVLTSYLLSGSWAHHVCVFDSVNDLIKLYSYGVLQDAETAYALIPASSNFKIASGGGYGGWQGKLDECFVYKGALSPKDVCRICSCGADGALCSCGGSTWADTGRNAEYCGSCELPQSCNTGFGVD